MKTIITTLALLFITNSYAQSNTDTIKGNWKIDLRPTPGSEPYYQMFEITNADTKNFSGKFYGSPIENGLLNTKWNQLYFAFITKDNSNVYYHSGYILNGNIYGITYCPNREFTAPWNGQKQN